MRTLLIITGFITLFQFCEIKSTYAQKKNRKADKYAIEIADLEAKLEALSLNIKEMVADNKKLSKTIKQLQEEKKELLIKAKKANYLYATNIRIWHHQLGKNNTSKIVTKAKKTNKSVVWFEYMKSKNDTIFGTKKINLVLYDWGGNIVNCQAEKFINKNTNSETCYSAENTINYRRDFERFNINLNYDKQLEPGLYKLEIYTDGYLSGKREFELK